MHLRLTTATAGCLLLLASSLPLRATQSYDRPIGSAMSPRNASYEIEVRLDHDARTLRGRETLRWRNISSRPAMELQFHLYWNAWRDANSTWLRERRLGGAAPPRPDMFGGIDITAIRLRRESDTSIDLLPQMRFIAPDDGNQADQTVMEVALPSPVEPLQGAVVDIEWTATIPRPFARTGWIDDYYFIAHWFPKIGVLEDEGWNTHQFHAATEFYADFGVYDVRITVPTGWIVGATGCRAPALPRTSGCPPATTIVANDGSNSTTHVFRAEDVHDFAWTTSPNFIDVRRTFSHPALPSVDVRLLLLPEHRHLEERYFDATFATLRSYGEWFGPYPYPGLTIVDPAYQSGAGGMEYPTIFTGASAYLSPATVRVPESTTAHEAGHQWWYGVVASNEFEHAWMDEGLNTYATARVVEETYPHNFVERRYFGGFVPWVFRDIPLRRTTDGNRLAGYRPVAESDVPETPTFRYWPPAAATISYNKTALWLNTLENMVGWPRMQQALAAYFQRWKFRHPSPNDFFDVLNQATGQDLTWFFDQVYRSSNVFDYAVQGLASERVGDRYRTTVVAQRLGEGTFPVEVVTTFRDGERIIELWNGQGRRATWSYERPVAALSAEVDPRRVLLLDIAYTNNSRTLSPRSGQAGLKWALKWMVWLQDLMLTYGFFV